jgi:hypothetical protein
MDTAPGFAASRVEPISAASVSHAAEADRLVTVTATYQLSEQGRKASLLAGGDGRGTQTITMQVPASRLHLVTVDAEGVAR